jgi:hypothetical protein
MLVDSTIYIDLLRRGEDVRYVLRSSLLSGQLFVCGVVRVEVLRRNTHNCHAERVIRNIRLDAGSANGYPHLADGGGAGLEIGLTRSRPALDRHCDCLLCARR